MFLVFSMVAFRTRAGLKEMVANAQGVQRPLNIRLVSRTSRQGTLTIESPMSQADQKMLTYITSADRIARLLSSHQTPHCDLHDSGTQSSAHPQGSRLLILTPNRTSLPTMNIPA